MPNRFRALPPVPGITSYGSWERDSWNNNGTWQSGVRLVSDHAPWRDLVAALDAEGVELPGDPVSALDEADAIVACCWRYGSYAHLLTAGESYSDFRKNPELSRVTDSEMMRINLEYSSGLAAWLAERTSDQEKVNRRARAGLQLLAMPWRSHRQDWPGWEAAAAEAYDRGFGARLPRLREYGERPTLTLRGEANLIVNDAYRNGPIEDLHAGWPSQGTAVPGFQRFYAHEMIRVCRAMVRTLRWALFFRERAGADFAWLSMVGAPRDWSETEETCVVTFPGEPGINQLGQRMCWLAARDPIAYGRLP